MVLIVFHLIVFSSFTRLSLLSVFGRWKCLMEHYTQRECCCISLSIHFNWAIQSMISSHSSIMSLVYVQLSSSHLLPKACSFIYSVPCYYILMHKNRLPL